MQRIIYIPYLYNICWLFCLLMNEYEFIKKYTKNREMELSLVESFHFRGT